MAEYISKDKVIEIINEFDSENRFADYSDYSEMHDIISELETEYVPQWISCKEQMPEDGISVLICSYRRTVHKATYDRDMGYFYIADSDLHYNELDITHWQPLPEPPKEDKP